MHVSPAILGIEFGANRTSAGWKQTQLRRALSERDRAERRSRTAGGYEWTIRASRDEREAGGRPHTIRRHC